MDKNIKRCAFCSFLNFLTVFLETFQRDLKFLVLLILVELVLLKDWLLNLNICQQFSSNVKKYPKKWAFVSEASRWSFKDVDEYSNRVANFFSGEGFKAGDEVALFMQSSPEEIMMILGLAKIGVVSAIINENSNSDSLVHSMSCINAKAIVFDPKFKLIICDAQSLLSKSFPNITYLTIGGSLDCDVKFTDIKEKLDTEISITAMTKHRIKYSDKLCYLYTSATNGLPVASIIRHSRFNLGIKMRNMFVGAKKDDTFYNTLPFHTAMGLILGAGTAFVSAQTVITRKFSASDFWKDCLRYQCTIANYTGEMPRYLLQQPPSNRDRDHKVRKIFGVAMRGTFAEQFKERFRIQQIYEFYFSTEGNLTLVNTDNKEGSCGFIPLIMPEFIRKRILPVALLKVNQETGELLRDKDVDIMCKPGETGMLCGRILENNPLTDFDGYVNRTETEKKIKNDIFVQGDHYFATGDLFTMDMFGYLYFKDRIGDTFKWKGEYVYSFEIESLISEALDGIDCIVYGVEIPNIEDKAGMVAIKNTEININTLYSKLFKVLPQYAVPVFVRLVETVDLSASFKYKKIALKKEGFDIKIVKDPLFVFDSNNRSYVRIDSQLYENIVNNLIEF